MSSPRPRRGFGLSCDAEGVVRGILRDSPGNRLGGWVGRPFSELWDEGSVEKARRLLAEIVRSGWALHWELDVAPTPGRRLTLRCAGSSRGERILVVGAPTPAGMASLLRELAGPEDPATRALDGRVEEWAAVEQKAWNDLTRSNNEMAGLRRELAKKNRQLERLNEQKNRFLGMAAHDLRNPLGVVQSFSELLLDELGPALRAKHRELLEAIHSSSRFMLDMANELLSVSAIESGRLELDRRPTDLRVVAERQAFFNRVFADRKSIAIDVTADPDLPLAEVDAAKIEQVLNNLIGNAVKYSPSGTTVHVGLRAAEDGSAVEVSIRDEGPGIPTEDLPRLLEAFQRGSTPATAGETSTGLGLAIARRIVEGHGSRLRVTSEPGAGATFAFTLRAASRRALAAARPVPAPRPATRPGAGSSLRVLLAEDSPFSRRLVAALLQADGHAVVDVENGEQALAQLAAASFDVLIVDLEMPVLGGLETTRELRARERAAAARPLPVLALTGHSEDLRDRSQDVGIDAWLTKPVQPEALRATLRRLTETPVAPDRR